MEGKRYLELGFPFYARKFLHPGQQSYLWAVSATVGHSSAPPLALPLGSYRS